MNKEEDRKEFVRRLRATEREGVDAVLEGLEKLGFFEAPASSRHHLAEPGGLCRHSLNVADQIEKLAYAQVELGDLVLPSYSEDRVGATPDSMHVVALLHDVCKADVYKQVEKFRKDAQGRWEKYQAYEYDASRCPLGHGEKSVIRLLKMGFALTAAETAAIRWHMGAWDLSDSREARENFSKACDKYPLLPLLIAADTLATRITENVKGE